MPKLVIHCELDMFDYTAVHLEEKESTFMSLTKFF